MGMLLSGLSTSTSSEPPECFTGHADAGSAEWLTGHTAGDGGGTADVLFHAFVWESACLSAQNQPILD